MCTGVFKDYARQQRIQIVCAHMNRTYEEMRCSGMWYNLVEYTRSVETLTEDDRNPYLQYLVDFGRIENSHVASGGFAEEAKCSSDCSPTE